MPALSDIRGQQRAIETVRRAIAADRVPHAYLFAGPSGCGKHTTALALAAALNCERTPGDGCAASDPAPCSPCDKIANLIHPDVVTLERQGAAQIIPIAVIREQVVSRMGVPPHEGRARLFIIEEAAALQNEAANALLKTLEEPPARTHFVLGTTAPIQLLPTIRSRCQRVPFVALPLAVQNDIGDDDPDAERQRELVAVLMRALVTERDADLLEAASTVAQKRTDVAPVLRLLARELHSAARDAVSREDVSGARAATRSAAAVLETEMTVTLHNAHGQLALDYLLRRLRAAGVVTALEPA